jgi:hypothetical protein
MGASFCARPEKCSHTPAGGDSMALCGFTGIIRDTCGIAECIVFVTAFCLMKYFEKNGIVFEHGNQTITV